MISKISSSNILFPLLRTISIVLEKMCLKYISFFWGGGGGIITQLQLHGMFLLVHCLLLFPMCVEVCVWPLFCNEVLSVFLISNHLPRGKLVAFL